MEKNNVYATESTKNTGQFVMDFSEIVKQNGFVVHNAATMDMGESFRAHGSEISDDFDLHMIQICKPSKAAQSLSSNPERAILMPKFVMTFSRDNKTQIRFLRYDANDIKTVVDDDVFPASLAETYTKIVEMIDLAK